MIYQKNVFEVKKDDMKQENVSPQWQRSALHWCTFILCFVDLAAIMGLEVGGVHIRVLLPCELAVNIQETVRHYRQLRVFVDEHLETQTHTYRINGLLKSTCTLFMVGGIIKAKRAEVSSQWKQQKGVMRNVGNQKPIRSDQFHQNCTPPTLSILLNDSFISQHNVTSRHEETRRGRS